jgi:hypothetical protein
MLSSQSWSNTLRLPTVSSLRQRTHCQLTIPELSPSIWFLQRCLPFTLPKHVHVHHIKASYENSSVISERTVSTRSLWVILWTSWDSFTSQQTRPSQLPGTLRSSFLFSASGPTLRPLRNATPSPNLLVEPSDRLFYASMNMATILRPICQSTRHCSLGVKAGSVAPCHNGFARSLRSVSGPPHLSPTFSRRTFLAKSSL